MRIGIVAGEASGDLLGASLIKALKEQVPGIEFEGIAGPAMIAEGCKAIYPSEKLSVMGLFEVLRHLREILAIRKSLYRHFMNNPPDAFIGIDAPDFNLGLERMLKSKGIRTIHYVSPSVWAWRQSRVKKIAQSVDLLLTLFPFEKAFYDKHGIASAFVGHPLADIIPLESRREEARQALGIDSSAQVIAVLPGSRMSELQRLSGVFLEACSLCHEKHQNLEFHAPMSGQNTRDYFEHCLRSAYPDLSVKIHTGNAHQVMAAANVVLLASGTATLEAMLLKKPMVVSYKLSPLTYFVLKKLKILKISRYSLPNILADAELVPELIQNDAKPDKISSVLLEMLDDNTRQAQLEAEFLKIHVTLRRNASHMAAQAVLSLVGRP